MAFQEFTFVTPSAELYVDVDVKSGEVLDLYADARDPVVRRGEWRPGLNPLFLHAVDPARAFAALGRRFWCPEYGTFRDRLR